MFLILEGLAKLRPVFQKDGLVNAGNASVRKSLHIILKTLEVCFLLKFFRASPTVRPLWSWQENPQSRSTASNLWLKSSPMLLSVRKLKLSSIQQIDLSRKKISGCDPTIMGIGPAPAIREVLKITGMKMDDIDIVEVRKLHF